MVWLAISCSLPQIVLRAIRLVLILRTNDAIHPSMPSPCLLVAEASVWATSPLAVTVKHIFCDFFVFLSAMLPSEIPKLPTDSPLEAFRTAWKLLLFLGSLCRTGLHP